MNTSVKNLNGYKFKRSPKEHQLTVLEKSLNLKGYGFLIDMGGGKTKVSIDSLGAWFHSSSISRAAIIAPNGIYKNWIKELKEDWPDYLPLVIKVWKEDDLQTFNVTPKNRDKALLMLLINVEALSTKKGQDYLKKFVNEETAVILDESTTIKNHKAKRTKNIIALTKKARFKRILSGYPTPQNQLDLFSQFEFLDPRILGHKSYYSFRNEFAKLEDVYLGPGRPQFKRVVGPRNTDKLQKLIEPYSVRIKKSECLDLPPKIFQTRDVELTPDQKRIYNEIRDDAIAKLSEEQYVSADMALTQMLRMHQVVCGFAVDESGEITPVKNNRISATIEALDQTDSCIIWANYRYNIMELYNAITHAFGSESAVTYYGDTKQRDREHAVHAFQQGEVRFFIANPATAGFGLTLTRAANVIYYSNSYNLEHRLQSEDRAHRIGQTRSVAYLDLIARGTVDEKVIGALKNKQALGDKLLNNGWKDFFS